MDLTQIELIAKGAASLGVGGLLAFAMFLYYRRDVLQASDNWQSQSATLLAVVKENTAAIAQLQSTNGSLQGSVNSLIQMIEDLRKEMNERELARLREKR